jgi:hypothetical protein
MGACAACGSLATRVVKIVVLLSAHLSRDRIRTTIFTTSDWTGERDDR